MVKKQIVIDSITKKVLCWGYCDFNKDDTFDPKTQEIITMEVIFDPVIENQDWKYNPDNQEFEKVI